MPYHYNSVDDIKQKIDKKKVEKEKKPRKKTQKELFEKKKTKLTKAQMDKLKEHSKMHKGGFRSYHMMNMMRFMKEGMTFTQAHNKAVKLDKERKKN